MKGTSVCSGSSDDLDRFEDRTGCLFFFSGSDSDSGLDVMEDAGRFFFFFVLLSLSASSSSGFRPNESASSLLGGFGFAAAVAAAAAAAGGKTHL
jgi:hypothetical protein